jgi:hypothetical protein
MACEMVAASKFAVLWLNLTIPRPRISHGKAHGQLERVLLTFKKRALAFAKLLLNIVALDLLGTQFESRDYFSPDGVLDNGDLTLIVLYAGCNLSASIASSFLAVARQARGRAALPRRERTHQHAQSERARALLSPAAAERRWRTGPR